MAKIEADTVWGRIHSFASLIGRDKIWLEDILFILFTDPDSIIGHANRDFYSFGVSFFCPYFYIDLVVWRRKFDSVTQEVQQNLLDSHLINNKLDFITIGSKGNLNLF